MSQKAPGRQTHHKSFQLLPRLFAIEVVVNITNSLAKGWEHGNVGGSMGISRTWRYWTAFNRRTWKSFTYWASVNVVFG